ncbi:Carnitine O-acetyltransferase mitochondrial [Savitreella phatthalungensis]
MAPTAQAQKRANSGVPAPYKEDSSKGPMLRWQESLPKLPVPPLEKTAERYIRSLEAILKPDELARSKEAVAKFLQTEGPELQQKLIERSKRPDVKNWLTEWWDYNAYMAYRDPVVINVSYFYSHKDDRQRRNNAARAAALSTAALAFRKQVVEGTLEPEYMKKLPICMDSYQYMWNCSRLPIKEADYVKKYSYDGDNQFILAMRKGRFFKIPHVGKDGKQLSTADLQAQFEKVLATATEPASTPIGALTSENRDIWLAARDELVKDSKNAKALEDIERSSFVVCLDDAKPATYEDRARQYWHGDGKNRWYDKPLHFIVNENGTSGFLGEHSMMDGTPTHRLNDYVCGVLKAGKVDHGDATAKSDLSTPEEITFNTTDATKQHVAAAEKQFAEVIASRDLRVMNYQGFGKGLIKKFKSSPDSFVQMVIQLAYYKFYGINRPTYESAATRRFQHGRTETCRSVSNESVAFCETMESATASNADKIAAFREAIKSHGEYINAASAGMGVDRHLFGLKQLLPKGAPVPEIYKDPAYAYSCKWFISSSQLSSEHFNGYGWGEVVPEGWGIAYMINEDSLNFNIVSRNLGCDKMQHYLREAADDMRDVLSTELAAPKAKL